MTFDIPELPGATVNVAGSTEIPKSGAVVWVFVYTAVRVIGVLEAVTVLSLVVTPSDQ